MTFLQDQFGAVRRNQMKKKELRAEDVNQSAKNMIQGRLR